MELYEKLIHSFELYANAIRIPSKRYLLISLLPPSKLQEILNEMKKAINVSNCHTSCLYHTFSLTHRSPIDSLFPIPLHDMWVLTQNQELDSYPLG